MHSEKRAFDTRVNRAAAAASQTAGKKGIGRSYIA